MVGDPTSPDHKEIVLEDHGRTHAEAKTSML